MVGKVIIPQNASQFQITGRNFPSSPRLAVVSVRMPTTSDFVIGASVLDGSYSQDGFVVYLTGLARSPGYVLDYFVSLKADLYDDWELYSVSYVEGLTLNGGPGWNGAWSFSIGTIGEQAYEDWELYSVGPATGTLNAPYGWSGAWSISIGYLGIISADDFESYSDGSVFNSLNGGTGWDAAYVDRANYFGPTDWDSFETYADGSNLNGLNGGQQGWSSAYVDRINYAIVIVDGDDFESYPDGVNLNGLTGGYGLGTPFDGNPYVDR